jgi:hypothetical protein
MARASKRVGFGPNKGAINPKISIGTEKPKNPKKDDIHIDFVRGNLSQYDGTNWIDFRLVYESDTEPDNKNVLWLDTGGA